jgi:hypothetical protein
MQVAYPQRVSEMVIGTIRVMVIGTIRVHYLISVDGVAGLFGRIDGGGLSACHLSNTNFSYG